MSRITPWASVISVKAVPQAPCGLVDWALKSSGAKSTPLKELNVSVDCRRQVRDSRILVISALPS